jgi:hypothetical protein
VKNNVPRKEREIELIGLERKRERNKGRCRSKTERTKKEKQWEKE